MKTRLNLLQLTVLLIMAVFAVVHAADVGKDEIMVAARKWIADNAVFQAESPDAVPEKATQLADDDGKAMPLWLVELAPSGYLVMSADDTLPPVAAFNTKGSFEMPVDHPLPSMLVRQGEIFQAELDKPKTRGNELAAENQTRWNSLLNRTRAETVTPSTIITAPLLTTEWNQNAPYNYFCPSGSSYVERAVTGCVPTAIAQMLKYHEWPIAGSGKKTYTDAEGNIQKTLTADFSVPYEWNAMTDIYTEKEERDYGAAELSVARLIMEMGVLVEADYELKKTGAHPHNIHTLMSQYLDYSSSSVFGDSRSGYIGYTAQSTIYSRIRTDMIEKRPAFVSYEGHTFIADGLGTMEGLDYYHFNYGWGGSSNGWYLLSDGYDNTVIISATTNIQPLPIAVFKPISCEQTSSFTLSWDFPKRIAAEAFRLTKTTGTRASTVISSSISGVARSYNLTGQSGTATYTLEAKVNGEWQAASDGVTVTVKTSPATMLSLTVDSNLKSIAGNQVSTVITANNSLANLTITSNRPDILPASGITVTGSGTSRTVRLTPSTGTVGNVFLYVTATDTAGNTLQKTIPLAVMEDEPLVWHTTKAEAFAAAEASGKLVLLVEGCDTCPNTRNFRFYYCEINDIKANILQNYELWYANYYDNDSHNGANQYIGELGGTRPLVAIIDPKSPSKRLRGHGGSFTEKVARAFLKIDLPYFSLDDQEIYVNGIAESLELYFIADDVEIRYRLDANEPTATDTLYSSAISLTGTTTVSARVFRNGQPISDTVTKTYTFLDQVAKPVLSTAQNDYFFSNRFVIATCATPGATIRYTTDGNAPTSKSSVFPDGGLNITEYTTVVVVAFKEGMKESQYSYSILTPLETCPDALEIATGTGLRMGTTSNAWFLQTSTYNSAPSAMQSGAIGDSESTTLVAKVVGSNTLTFNWKVSSERNYDKLTFSIDGVEKNQISGTVGWEQKEYTISGDGDHYLVWTYAKDSSQASNSDCAWVDDIVWGGNPVIDIDGPPSIAYGSTAKYSCTMTSNDGTISPVTPTWSLSSTTYASVDENGVVTNKNTTTTDKTVRLNASYQEMTAEPKDIILKGQAQPIILVSIAIDGPASIATASTATYTCTATWSDGTTTPVKPTWTFEPTTTYASVSTTGEVVNKNTETTDKTVTLKASYTDNGVTKTDSKGITLAKKELTGVSIVGPDRIVAEGTATYTCTASWTYGESTTETPTWTVEPSTYANVDSTGKVTNKNTTTSEQTVTLTASMTVNGVTKSDSKNITLARENPPDVPTQTLSLTAGWNWVSFNVLPTSHKVGDVLGMAGFSANDIVQTNDGMCLFTGSGWFPGSFAIEHGRLYQIYVASANTVVVHGEACEENEFPLASGWNWIGNPTATAVSPSELTHSGGWTAGDRIQSPDGNVMFMGDKWLPANGLTLEPGKGCQIYTANAGTLSFPMPDADDALYVVVDLSGGPDAASYPVRYSATGPDLNDDTCRTTELWLRKIPAGTFTMGSPEDEVGHQSNETQHEVTLTQDYYMGVFECTQKQWELVMGTKPSFFNNEDYYATRPVEQVSYDMIRGTSTTAGAGWPTYGHAVDSSSFMGKLQAKTGLTFDLPTEAQWEYACRAGTTTLWNSGNNWVPSSFENMKEVGRYYFNGGGFDWSNCTTANGTAKVGSYKPNAWGLYDMHGNVEEWCLDWYDSYGNSSVEEPAGPSIGSSRVLRGGFWRNEEGLCRSAYRISSIPSDGSFSGFRIAYHPKQNLYAVVDLSGGPDATNYPVRYTDTAPNLDDDTCRTTELWLRKIPAGTFIMGSPEDEVGHNCSSDSNETQHEVTLTQDYYIGVFECTQRQWELVMGSKPSYYSNATYYATRPVEQVSYDMIRGTSATTGAGWPTYGHAVDASSFMGKLQAKTGLTFDLPTEAQWEHACRAGTTTALNSGKNLTSTSSDIAMDEVGRYLNNGGSSYSTTCTTANGTAKVGSYIPNAWGLYDMHGNLWEWCLDWWYVNSYGTDAVSDPVGPTTGSVRVLRGGGWNFNAQYCRSAYRGNGPPSYGDGQSYFGFRVVCLPRQDLYAVVDLSGGPDAVSYPVRYTDIAPNLDDDTCRTTELWLRKIPAGTFIMGSPEDEVGRRDNETQHEVTLTQDYYIGVFECTQRQWELVMGSNPSHYKGDGRPVEQVSYDMVRGTGAQTGAGWPTYGHVVDASSFMGRLQEKTGLVFDLPTEAQWEYACRAGTTTALNSGKNLVAEEDAAMDEVGRYCYNRYDGKGGYSQHTKVGSYLPNAWGLYDMHGNLWEWCLDRWPKSSYGIAAVSDPVGPTTGSSRVLRGGCWSNDSYYCRSAHRAGSASITEGYGFRIACLP